MLWQWIELEGEKIPIIAKNGEAIHFDSHGKFVRVRPDEKWSQPRHSPAEEIRRRVTTRVRRPRAFLLNVDRAKLRIRLTIPKPSEDREGIHPEWAAFCGGPNVRLWGALWGL
jgi:hypothetical protein